MNHIIVETLLTQKAWGRKQLTDTFRGDFSSVVKMLVEELKPVTNTSEVIETLAELLVLENNLSGALEQFNQIFNEETSMIGKDHLQDILRTYWNSNKERLKQYPKAHTILKEIVSYLGTNCKASNSNKAIRLTFYIQLINRLV